MYQTSISGKTREPDASALERGSELDEQILRLQCLVSYLLEKNEELRQRLATSLRAEEQRSTRLTPNSNKLQPSSLRSSVAETD